VTAWEAFIEDAIRVAFGYRIIVATSPHHVKSTYCHVADGWLNSGAKRRAKPEDLIHWTGDGWKEVLKEKLAQEIEAFHTPNSENIRKLSKRYIGWDLTTCWKWRHVSSSAFCTRLDKLIHRRGELVHRGKELFDRGGSAGRREANDALALTQRLVKCSTEALLRKI
jgi:hypothetical protein